MPFFSAFADLQHSTRPQLLSIRLSPRNRRKCCGQHNIFYFLPIENPQSNFWDNLRIFRKHPTAVPQQFVWAPHSLHHKDSRHEGNFFFTQANFRDHTAVWKLSIHIINTLLSYSYFTIRSEISLQIVGNARRCGIFRRYEWKFPSRQNFHTFARKFPSKLFGI